jgi:hypothetical protein
MKIFKIKETYMGFDLVAFDAIDQSLNYFHANMSMMDVLRHVMEASGLNPEFVRTKFRYNFDYSVEPVEALEIAGKLNTWLTGSDLVVNLYDFDEKKIVPLEIDGGLKEYIELFAKFCENSNGFWVD